jgi:tRNA dimethylallyltransferase
MQDIWSRGRQPLFVGGTMLYFHALSNGIAALPGADPGVRAAIDALAAESGWAAVHRELARVDPQAAARIHSNDPQRLQRALEVCRLTGQPISLLQRTRVSVIADIHTLEFAFAPLDRNTLHAHLKHRFDAMLQAGFVDEVRQLRERSDLTMEHPSMRAVGYRQMWRHLAGEWSLAEASDRAVVATRQLAKRQLTWLRARPRARWFDAVHRDVASMVINALSEGGISQ